MSCTAGAAGRHAMNKHRILFLAANPSKGTGVVLDKECAAIEHELRLTSHRDDFTCPSLQFSVGSARPTRVHVRMLPPTLRAGW